MLRCGDCGAQIKGFTGLQEIQSLKTHMKRKHKITINTSEALEIRIKYEANEPYLALDTGSNG